jgi:hypothetical protein
MSIPARQALPQNPAGGGAFSSSAKKTWTRAAFGRGDPVEVEAVPEGGDPPGTVGAMNLTATVFEIPLNCAAASYREANVLAPLRTMIDGLERRGTSQFRFGSGSQPIRPLSVEPIGRTNWNRAPLLPSDDAVSRPPWPSTWACSSLLSRSRSNMTFAPARRNAQRSCGEIVRRPGALPRSAEGGARPSRPTFGGQESAVFGPLGSGAKPQAGRTRLDGDAAVIANGAKQSRRPPLPYELWIASSP